MPTWTERQIREMVLTYISREVRMRKLVSVETRDLIVEAAWDIVKAMLDDAQNAVWGDGYHQDLRQESIEGKSTGPHIQLFTSSFEAVFPYTVAEAFI